MTPVPMPRYEVIDPTGEGFPQVVDVSNRSAPRLKKILNDAGVEVEIEVCEPLNRRLPMLRVVASFTPYMPDALLEAQALCNRLNAGIEAMHLIQKLSEPKQQQEESIVAGFQRLWKGLWK